MKHRLALCALSLLLLCACNRELTDYVNPFVGTDLHGHTYPGAVVPFGMIQPGPDTRLEGWDGCSCYHYSDDTLYGFSHTHLSGTGVEDYGDILLMPFMGEMSADQIINKDYKSHFAHRNEDAEPGYYCVILDQSRIMAELTCTERVAFHKYNFPSNGSKGIVVDLTHRDKTLSCTLAFDSTANRLTGYRHSSSWSPNQHCHFALSASEPIARVEYFKAPDGKVDDESPRAYAVLYFADNVKEVELQVAISAVDEQGALCNLATAEGLRFDEARQQAHNAWLKELGKIEVEGGDKEDLRVFYTSLYHCMLSPYLYSDADGRYRGQNDSIYTCAEGRKIYTVFSLWDTYRALHPLLTLIDRERTADFIYTFARCWETGGELPMWELASHETHCMIGYHACPVILDALRAGILDEFSPELRQELLQAMVATSNRTPAHVAYAQQGFLSSEVDNESVSKTLEYAFDDWCIAQYAKAIEADSALIAEYERRSLSWMNIMDDKGFMHARRNGGFVTPFSPSEVNNHYTEANSWQYSTYVPHHLKQYFALLGGNDVAERFIDSLFHTTAKLEGRDQSDIDGLIGLYAHGNEPSHHAAYLYNYLGRQWKTAELVRKICLEMYTSQPDGEIGNDDCGQMAAWYVLSALGFYPVCPGSDHYAVGSPLFEKATLHLENGNSLVINCNGQGHKNPYVGSLAVNGVATQCAFLSGSQLREGGVLDFAMSASPNEQFGSEGIELFLTSAHTDSPVPAPYFSRWEQRFNDSTSVAILSPHPIYYTTDGTMPDTLSARYTSPIPVKSDIVLKAVAFDGKHYSAVATQQLTRFVADKRLSYLTEPDQQYRDSGEEGLIDRLYGTVNYRIGGWQGWQGDAEVVIDLLEPRPLTGVKVDCLSDCRSWVFFPSAISVEASSDGTTYKSVASRNHLADDAMKDPDWNYKQDGRQSAFILPLNTTARYLRIKVTNYGILPSWHISAGQHAWLFIDEIEIL